MRKRRFKQIVTLLLCFLLLSGTVTVQAEEKITPSTVNYKATFRDASLIFIGNEKAVDWEVGDKYFLTYTVNKVESNENFQSGMIATTDPNATHPYNAGNMQYTQESILCEEGYTYFFRFEVTKDGWTYVAAKAKGNESEYIKLPHVEGDLKKHTPYFGIWLGEGGGLTTELSRIRCYDEKGTDLGVHAPLATTIDEVDMTELVGINHTYSFSVADAYCVAFGNARETDSDVVFLEYTVSNVEAKDVTQSGVIMTNLPTENYPFGENSGSLCYEQNTAENPAQIITKGARYLVRFERGEEKFEVLVKRTLLDGTVDYIGFSNYYGTYNQDFGYVCMWIGEICSLTADFTNVKCYDEDGNNLGIQTNKNVKIQHFGELEDYSGCEAVYYCKENNTFISLDDEKNVSKYLDGEKSASQGTYSIEKAVMTLQVGEETEEFDYYYNSFVDKDGNRYIRLQEQTVTFHSEFMEKETLETIKVTAKEGFKVVKPQDPSQEGRTFLYWQTGEKEEYDFNQVVTESLDLYAVWAGEAQRTQMGIFGGGFDWKPILLVVAACIALAGGTVAGIVVMNRRQKDGGTKEEGQ